MAPLRLRSAALAAVLLAGLAPATGAAASAPSPAAKAAPTALVGTFKLTAGSCSGGKVTGTYLRMILPSGGTNGPYMANSDSTCSDQSFTPLRPGTDGGLKTGGYQQPPSPAFDGKGNARANRITATAVYYGTAFATATAAKDPQTGKQVAAPRILLNGTKLSGDLSAFAVTWNSQNFNQGAPKPGGARPGNTTLPTGTYDPATRRFTLDWASQVTGGPFDKFTGKWHLEGVFEPASGQAAPGTGNTGGTPSSGAVPQGGTATAGADGGAAPTGPAASAVPSGAPVPTDAAGAPLPATNTAGTPTAVPQTETTTRQVWEVSRPVVVIATLLGVAALLALIALSLLNRRRTAGVA